MNSQFRDKIPSGTFAKLCGIPKKTLLFYDEIGLFSPECVAPNGYRYYSYRQYDVLTAILALREIGMPLKEIKTYMQNRTPENMLALFENQDRKLRQEIKKRKATRRFLQSKIAQTNAALRVSTNQITVEQQTASCLAVTALSQGASRHAFSQAWTEHVRRCMENGLNIGYTDGTILPVSAILQGNYNHYTHFITHTDTCVSGMDFLEKPAGQYLIAYHRGPYSLLSQTYQKILAFAKKHNITLGDYAFEEGLLDELVVSSSDQLLTKVSVSIR